MFLLTENEEVYEINVCFSCMAKLTEKFPCKNRYLAEAKKILCYCQYEKVFGYASLKLPKKVFDYHVENNRQNYQELLETVKGILQYKYKTESEFLKKDPRDLWIEKTKHLPLDLEEDFVAWLEIYQRQIELKKAKFVKNFLLFCEKTCQRLNIPLTDDIFNIQID